MSTRQQEVPAIFGQRVKHERERRNWTMRDLGTRCGMNASTILRVEAGHDMALSSALQFAALLSLSLDALVAAPECARCDGKPPTGFICTTCGREGAS